MAEIYGRGKGYEIKGKMKKSLGIKEKEDNWNIWKRKKREYKKLQSTHFENKRTSWY